MKNLHILTLGAIVLLSCSVSYGALPVADAGADQTVLDRDGSGAEEFFLDGRDSTDDGTIVGYLWEEGTTTISTESLLRTSLAVGTHTIQLEVELRQATKKGELRAHYQPLIDLKSGQIVGVDLE